MALDEDLLSEVLTIFRQAWTTRDGTVVPDDSSVTLDNDGVKLDATVLYADIDGSTALVDEKSASFAAEVYKSFLRCAAKIIRSEGGVITAYDGDRVMAVYIGGSKNTSAARTALKLNWARIHIINPAIEKVYGAGKYRFEHVVGVDTSTLLVAKTGVRGANDLVWVGPAANHAAKLSALSSLFNSNITQAVFDEMHPKVRNSSAGTEMWQQAAVDGRTIYRSNWTWKP